MVIIGLLSSQHQREHHLRHELDQLLFDDRIQRDFAVACQIELKLLHAVPPLLFEEQSHWHLSSLDLLPARPTLLEHWHSISHWERSRFLTRPDEPSTAEFLAKTHEEFEQSSTRRHELGYG